MGTRKRAGITLALVGTALLLATEMPEALSSAVGGSAALAELAARSPGARIGGVALKGKAPRVALAKPAVSGPSKPTATVLGTSLGPEGLVPTSGPAGGLDLPTGFVAPGIPGVPSGASPALPGTDFGNGSPPSLGGPAIIIPGGGGGIVTPPGETPGGGTIVPPIIPPGVGGIPEPSTWFMLIVGFGMVGGTMRRSRRVRFA